MIEKMKIQKGYKGKVIASVILTHFNNEKRTLKTFHRDQWWGEFIINDLGIEKKQQNEQNQTHPELSRNYEKTH